MKYAIRIQIKMSNLLDELNQKPLNDGHIFTLRPMT